MIENIHTLKTINNYAAFFLRELTLLNMKGYVGFQPLFDNYTREDYIDFIYDHIWYVCK